MILTPTGSITAVRITPVAGKPIDYTITVDELELGAAWKRHSSKTGKVYLSVKLGSAFRARSKPSAHSTISVSG